MCCEGIGRVQEADAYVADPRAARRQRPKQVHRRSRPRRPPTPARRLQAWTHRVKRHIVSLTAYKRARTATQTHHRMVAEAVAEAMSEAAAANHAVRGPDWPM
jgi:hypothetical protein